MGGVASNTTGGINAGRDAGPGQQLQDYLGNSGYSDDFWQVATPTQSGMNAAILQQALDFVQSKGWEIHAFLIARNGHLLFERYGWKSGNNPNDPDKVPHQVVPSERHPIFSVTKSIMSALVGQAIADGFISGVDHKVADWFTDYAELNPSAQKSSITLEQLLMMRSGLTFAEGESTVFNDEPNPARALLSRDLATAPGAKWNYSSGDAEIVAEVLRITTGHTPLEYAQTKLFGPLGIVDPPWDAGKSGTNHGGFGLSLTAREMARFGELYRNGGLWGNQQVVPASWVSNSTAYKCPTEWGMDYGYYWFLPNVNDFFVAIGFNGQQIFVSRNYGLVIVFTGDIPSSEANIDYTQIITNYIIPAIIE
jgi:CubicO group peptidase (beta-lactamase class C family)